MERIRAFFIRLAVHRFTPALTALVYAFFAPIIFTMQNSLFYTDGIAPLFVALFTFFYFRFFLGLLPQLRAYLKSAVLPSLIIAAALWSGWQIERSLQISFFSWRLLAGIALIAFVLIWPTAFLYKIIYEKSLRPERPDLPSNRFFDSRYFYLIIWASLMLLWLPALLADWPGILYGDSEAQLREFSAGVFTGTYSLLHTLILGSLVSLGRTLFGSVNAGVGLYILVQMAVTALALCYTVSLLRKAGISRKIQYAVLAYFALSPVIGLFISDANKDFLATVSLSVFSLTFACAWASAEEFFSRKLDIAVFVLSAFAAVSLRYSVAALFYVLLAAAFLRLLIKRSKASVKLFAALAASAALLFIWQGLIGGRVVRDARPVSEYLSIPIHQIAKTFSVVSGELSEDEIQGIYEVLDPERLQWFDDDNADYIKVNFDNDAFNADPLKYVKLWGKLGLRYPNLYLTAFLELNYKQWYPDSVFDSYSTFPYVVLHSDSLYHVRSAELPVVPASKLPFLRQLRDWAFTKITFSRVPLLSLLFAPAFMLYILLFVLGYAAKRSSISFALSLVGVLSHLGALFPATTVVRYTLLSFFLAPLALAFMFHSSSVTANPVKEENP